MIKAPICFDRSSLTMISFLTDVKFEPEVIKIDLEYLPDLSFVMAVGTSTDSIFIFFGKISLKYF